MKKAILAFIGICLFFVQSCKKDNNSEVAYLGKNYFPTNIGHELIYDVDLITKSSFDGLWDSSHYQIKEMITETYPDNQNRNTQRIERYIKNDTSPDWTIYKVWASNLLETKGQREEDNIRYNKLNFPPSSQFWNGNIENTLVPREYQYTTMHVPLTLGSLSFDSTLTVLQYEDANLIDSIYYMEQYATNVGMIYKINKEINYNYCGNPACDSIIDAYIYQETLVSYKK